MLHGGSLSCPWKTFRVVPLALPCACHYWAALAKCGVCFFFNHYLEPKWQTHTRFPFFFFCHSAQVFTHSNFQIQQLVARKAYYQMHDIPSVKSSIMAHFKRLAVCSTKGFFTFFLMYYTDATLLKCKFLLFLLYLRLDMVKRKRVTFSLSERLASSPPKRQTGKRTAILSAQIPLIGLV